MIPVRAILAFFCLIVFSGIVAADLVLSEEIMNLALISAELSILVNKKDPPSDGYGYFEVFDMEPDQAIVAQRDGYCFGSFRGSTATWADWVENLDVGMEDVCNDDGTCCSTRTGFYKAYYADYNQAFEDSVRECAAKCDDKNECVVFGGFSQGAAIAAVAALAMSDLNPYVIAFGQPATVDSPCPLVSSRRWFRFINTRKTLVGIAYDPIPFGPGFGAKFFGHMIILGEDPSGVADIGLDVNERFNTLDIAGFDSHSMKSSSDGDYPGYLDRLKTLIENTDVYPVRADGFGDSYLCSEDKECQSENCGYDQVLSYSRCIGTECADDDECSSGRCDSGTCLAKLGSCMLCNEDSDCASDKCYLFHCAGSNGLMDDDCICLLDLDCASGRCDLLESGSCQAKLPLGASCNEDSDCLSDNCPWGFGGSSFKCKV